MPEPTGIAAATNAVAKTATYGGSGAAFVTATTLAEKMSIQDWQIVGIVGGLIIAALGLLLKTGMDWHFRQQHLKLAQSRAKVLAEMQEADE